MKFIDCAFTYSSVIMLLVTFLQVCAVYYAEIFFYFFFPARIWDFSSHTIEFCIQTPCFRVFDLVCSNHGYCISERFHDKIFRSLWFHMDYIELPDSSHDCSGRTLIIMLKAAVIVYILYLILVSMLCYLGILYIFSLVHYFGLYCFWIYDFLFWVQDEKCIVIDWGMTKAVVSFRCLTDAIYLLNIFLQVHNASEH